MKYIILMFLFTGFNVHARSQRVNKLHVKKHPLKKKKHCSGMECRRF